MVVKWFEPVGRVSPFPMPVVGEASGKHRRDALPLNV